MSWIKSPDGAMHPFLFTPSELRQLLSAYSEGVLKKHWKDYGIQSTPKETLFAVIERSEHASNTAIICGLKKSNTAPHFFVYDGEKPVLKTTSFLEALNKFKSLDPKASTKSTKSFKKKYLKIIS
jgi:hypothetical protein